MTVDGPPPHDADSWAQATESFAKLLAAEIDDADLFECDFSTSTEVERTVGRIVLLDVYAPYFSLWMMAVCGIPTVTLTGTAEDWQRIRARIDTIAGFGLETWCRSLAPITDEFARAAAGNPDPAFWRRIYNPVDAYGGDYITGWITRFYPYLKGETVDVPNHLLDLPIGEPRDVTVRPGDFYSGPGIASTSVPATLSRVVVNINDRTAGDNGAVALHGGLVAVAQDPDGALRPVAGWHVTRAPIEIADVIDRIIRDHDTTPPQTQPTEGPAELFALYGRLGSATLFNGRWHLVPAPSRRHVHSDDDLALMVTTLIDLPGDHCIAAVTDETLTTYWALCRLLTAEGPFGPQLRLADAPTEIPLLGTSLAALLSAALDTDGDVTHLETGTLATFSPPSAQPS